jgi:hypothetical protein
MTNEQGMQAIPNTGGTENLREEPSVDPALVIQSTADKRRRRPMKTSDKIASAALVISILAWGTTGYYSKRAYDLNAARDQREQRSKRPAIDIQMRPSQNPVDVLLDVSITNRSDINISPQVITISAPPTAGFDSGIGSLTIGKTGVGEITSPVAWLLEMGPIKPGASGSINLTVRAKSPPFPTGTELQFAVWVRLADEQDSVEQYRVIRRISFN